MRTGSRERVSFDNNDPSRSCFRPSHVKSPSKTVFFIDAAATAAHSANFTYGIYNFSPTAYLEESSNRIAAITRHGDGPTRASSTDTFSRWGVNELKSEPVNLFTVVHKNNVVQAY